MNSLIRKMLFNLSLLSIISLSLLTSSCDTGSTKRAKQPSDSYSEVEILHELNQAFNELPSERFPAENGGIIRYNFFPDLEHGYCETAGNRFHLYADSLRWAIVFEKNGYMNRASAAETELLYFGNCITYPTESYQGSVYVSNMAKLSLVDADEFARIKAAGEDGFELISSSTKMVTVKNAAVTFEHDPVCYEKAGIAIRNDENPGRLIGFADFVRYLHETAPNLLWAQEADILKHLPVGIPRIAMIEKYHFISAYDKSTPPSAQETYKLFAKMLVHRDSALWKPRQKANNHWSNWESVNL